MEVLTEKMANKLMIESLFKSGGTLSKSDLPYCTGRYNESIIGKELTPCSSDIRCIYAVKKYGSDGKYYQLRSLKV